MFYNVTQNPSCLNAQRYQDIMQQYKHDNKTHKDIGYIPVCISIFAYFQVKANKLYGKGKDDKNKSLYLYLQQHCLLIHGPYVQPHLGHLNYLKNKETHSSEFISENKEKCIQQKRTFYYVGQPNKCFFLE